MTRILFCAALFGVFLLFFFFMIWISLVCLFFFFNDTAPPEIYPLSLHDALPICARQAGEPPRPLARAARPPHRTPAAAHRSLRDAEPDHRRGGFPDREQTTPHAPDTAVRSEEHTSELQSQSNLVCRLLLEKKKKN